LGKEDLTVPLPLEPVADYEFQDPNQIVHDDQGIKAKSPGKFVSLKPGLLHVNLVFVPPGKNFFKNKKVEWLIEAPGGQARVQYALEGQKLTRKVIIGEEISGEKETKSDAQSAGQDSRISLHVRVDGNRVRVANDKGVLLDDFTASGQDFANGTIAIKTDSHFMVKSENQ
jgi:hypothetical protein